MQTRPDPPPAAKRSRPVRNIPPRKDNAWDGMIRGDLALTLISGGRAANTVQKCKPSAGENVKSPQLHDVLPGGQHRPGSSASTHSAVRAPSQKGYLQPCLRVMEVPVVQADVPEAYQLVTEHRLQGIPCILEGHRGACQFADGWVRESGGSGGLQLDTAAFLKDVGSEVVNVLLQSSRKEQRRAQMTVEEFVRKHWERSNPSCYMQQWQFPLSTTGGKKLNRRHTSPMALGDDLLQHMLDHEDPPYQYLFMGHQGTHTRLHRDKGGLAILLMPIVGVKRCVLVHRDDTMKLYHEEVNLQKPNFDKHPMFAFARIWQVDVQPGQMLVMPHGTYHDCTNLTPCLSYSRFHLDTVNLPGFIRSFHMKDAPEVDHLLIVWNAACDLQRLLDAYLATAANLPAAPAEALSAQVQSRSIRRRQSLVALRHAARHLLQSGDAARGVFTWQQLLDDIDGTLQQIELHQAPGGDGTSSLFSVQATQATSHHSQSVPSAQDLRCTSPPESGCTVPVPMVEAKPVASVIFLEKQIPRAEVMDSASSPPSCAVNKSASHTPLKPPSHLAQSHHTDMDHQPDPYWWHVAALQGASAETPIDVDDASNDQDYVDTPACAGPSHSPQHPGSPVPTAAVLPSCAPRVKPDPHLDHPGHDATEASVPAWPPGGAAPQLNAWTGRAGDQAVPPATPTSAEAARPTDTGLGKLTLLPEAEVPSLDSAAGPRVANGKRRRCEDVVVPGFEPDELCQAEHPGTGDRGGLFGGGLLKAKLTSRMLPTPAPVSGVSAHPAFRRPPPGSGSRVEPSAELLAGDRVRRTDDGEELGAVTRIAKDVDSATIHYTGYGPHLDDIQPLDSIQLPDGVDVAAGDLQLGTMVQVLWGVKRDPWSGVVQQLHRGPLVLVKLHKSTSPDLLEQWFLPDQLCKVD